MKMCDSHWARLRKAIDDRGLTALVAKSGPESQARMVAEVAQGQTRTTFDPLMAAFLAIVSNAVNVAGPAVMFDAPGQQTCPLCFLPAHCQCGKPKDECVAGWDKWIERAADDSLERAKELGLVGADGGPAPAPAPAG